MAMEKTELKGCEELKESIQKVFDKIEDGNMKYNANLAVLMTLTLLHFIQTNPLIIRLRIWECNYYFYDFLRKNKQLRRTQNRFDEVVTEFIVDTLHSASGQKV